MSRVLIAALLIVALCGIAEALGRQQSASVRGKLMCKGRPAGGLNVKLYDHDTFTPDDKMAGVISNADGTFNIAGHKSEFTRVRPDVKIYHKCGHIFSKCYKLRIPDNYVTAGSSPAKVYDIGTIHLETVKNNC